MKKLFYVTSLTLLVIFLFQTNILYAGEENHPPPDIIAQAGPPPPPGPLPPLNDRQKSDVLSFIQKNMPSTYKSLQEIKGIDPGRYEQALIERYGMMMDLNNLSKNDPDAYKDVLRSIQLEDQSMELAKNYRKAGSSQEKEQITKKLKAVLSELFDLREKERERRIKQLEQQLSSLKESLNNRRKNKDSIVQQRVDELTGKKEYLEW